ncbi:MAG: sigma-54-dependent transcriptional regulator [Dongiaceae bacterium]
MSKDIKDLSKDPTKTAKDNSKHEILIVDDEKDIRFFLENILKDEGFQIRTAGTDAEAIQAVRERRPSLVILDIWLQGSKLDGIGLLDNFKREYPTMPAVMISGHGSIEAAVAAIKKGAYEFIEKPFKSDKLLLTIERAIEAARLQRENEELRLKVAADTNFNGSSPVVMGIKQTIERVAPTNSRVFITGPAGSGKELVARMLHKQSKRADGPFVVLNCATLRPDRLEIELFGTEAGKRDADEVRPESMRKMGTLEQAHNGTLLLDEVADMPLETQGKILRVLQEQTFQRVGGNSPVKVDVRILASSNKNLAEVMGIGRFRQDLYYRLNVVPIQVPALKDRREDIPELAKFFIEKIAEGAGMPIRRLKEDAMAALQSYNWPGNVRQLRNVIEWLLIMASGSSSEPIGADLLPPEINGSTSEAIGWNKTAEIMTLPLRDAREIFEREYLLAQVTRFGGNISRTASFIGMERSALHRKLKSLGVNNGQAAPEEEPIRQAS